MKYLLLILIKLYWRLIPGEKRKHCIYKQSCSCFVFEQTKVNGFISGMKALSYRMRTCNSHFHLFINPVTKETELILSNGEILSKNEIAERLI